MCIVASGKKKSHNELSFSQIRSIFEENKKYLSNIRWFQLTGGEPFLRDDLNQIVSFLSDFCDSPIIWIPSNGLLTNRIVAMVSDLVATGCNNLGITFSIDGNEKTHNFLRGGSDFYERTLNTIKKVKSIQHKYSSLKVNIGFTISPKNFNQILEVYNLSKKLGVGFSMRPIHVSPIYYENEDIKYQKFSDSAIEIIKKQIDIILNKECKDSPLSNAIRRIYYYGILEYIKNPNSINIRCYAGSNSLCLDEQGNVFPCLFYKKRLGNLLDERLKDIFKKDVYRSTLKDISQGRCPKCWVECEIARYIKYNIFKIFKNLF